MSELRVDDILDKEGVSAPGFSKGAIVTGVCTATTFVGALTGNVTATTLSGTLTGTASGLAGSPDITVGDVGSTNETVSKQLTAEHSNVTGVSTATSFVGALTGNASGSSGSCTGNAAGLTGNPNIVITNLDTSGTLVEAFSSTTTAYSSSGDLNISNGNLQFCSANLAGTNNTLNIMSTTGINTDLATGQALNVTAITAVNASTAYVNQITIDGKAVTETWVGGSAPTDGGTAGYDTYSFNILKTGSETFICIANQVKTS